MFASLRSLSGYLLLIAFFSLPLISFSQEEKKVPDGTEGIYFVPLDSTTGKPIDPPATEANTSFSTFKIGMGFIYDVGTNSQDDVFKQQMDSLDLELNTHAKVRDFRVLGSGQLKTKRTFAWKFAYMYDGDKELWYVRETGVTIGVPELAGHVFVGRTKEGYSMVKVMNGHSPWTMERQMALDPIPILADGIKYYGYLQKSRIFWNLAYFNDIVSKGQGFSTFSWQYVARVGWMPLYNKEKSEVVHVAVNYRYGKPLDGKFSIKSRPESNITPQLINTGSFLADHSTHIGGEIYYSNGRMLLGSEMMVHNFSSDLGDEHHFFGGDVVFTYFFTKTKRPYNTVGSIFGFIPVTKSVFKGGMGEIEGVLHVSTFNLNDGAIKGGQFWRITPMINWYMTKVMRWEFVYGYGVLDRFNLKGNVQFFREQNSVHAHVKNMNVKCRLKYLIPAVVFLFTGFSARTQEADSTKANQKDLIDLFLSITNWETKANKRGTNKVNFSLVPGGGAVGESRVIVTAVNAAFYLGDSSTTNLSNLYFIPYSDFAGRYGIIIRPNFWTEKNILNFSGEVRFGSYSVTDYGLGSSSTDENTNELNYDHTRLYATASRLIINHFYVGLGYNQDYFYNVDDIWKYDGESDFTKYETGTQKSTRSSGIAFNLLRDSRKNSINPVGGFYSNVIYKVNTHALGSSFEWTSLYLDYRKYISLSERKHSILGFWTYYWGTYGDVPYLNLPGTALDLSGRSGRGYLYGRFRGKQMLYAESEYRFDLSSNGFWGGVVFVNAESVTESTSEKFEYIRPAAGFGLRLKFNKKSASNVTLDFGIGKNSFNIRLNLGEFF